MQAVYRDHMGNDLEVVNDARVSFGKETSAEEWHHITVGNNKPAMIPTLNQSDTGLIRFLARGCSTKDWDNTIDSLVNTMDRSLIDQVLQSVRKMPTHWTPFAHQMIKLNVCAPVPIRTQCFKHKIGFVENEESRRYVTSTPSFFTPHFRELPAGSIKQGSGGIHPDDEELRREYNAHSLKGLEMYERFLELGVAPEQARFTLTQGVEVNWVWTGSLYGFACFYNSRSDRSHAQGEIADLAEMVGNIMKQLYPVSWAALVSANVLEPLAEA